MRRNLFVVKKAPDAEGKSPELFGNPGDVSGTLEPYLLSELIGRGHKNLDGDVTADGRTNRALDQSAIQRNSAREAASGMLAPIVPVEDDGQAERITDCRSALLSLISQEEEGIHN